MSIFEKFESLTSSKGLSLLPSYTLSLAFINVPFSCLFCLKLHDFTPFKTEIFWGRTPPPPPMCHCDIIYTFYKLKQSSRMWFLRGENTAGCHIYIIFFFACQKFSEDWNPLTKIPGSAPGFYHPKVQYTKVIFFRNKKHLSHIA